MTWKCKGCGACCQFISISVTGIIDTDMIDHLKAHGLIVTENKIIIPARCKYLTEDNKCSIYDHRFNICKRAGKGECKEAKKNYEEIK